MASLFMQIWVISSAEQEVYRAVEVVGNAGEAISGNHPAVSHVGHCIDTQVKFREHDADRYAL